MAGIYLHIPFCKRKCHYCNFFSVASMKHRDEIVSAICQEIEQKKDYLSSQVINTIYFGGGTPSMLGESEINRILETIYTIHPISEDAEITLEINPDDINLLPNLLPSPARGGAGGGVIQIPARGGVGGGVIQIPARGWPGGGVIQTPVGGGVIQIPAGGKVRGGVNRLSIGIQSFFDEDLHYLNRVHSAQQALEVVTLAQQQGITNISIDLIFGIPTLTNAKWFKNLEIAFSLNVPHISAYALTVEPKTALDVMIRKGSIEAPLDEQAAEQFQILMKEMKQNGFLHYEISNYCKDGFFSRHNSNYWNGEHYLGIGPSAHSFNGSSRQWNSSGIIEYIKQIENCDSYFDMEILTKSQKLNEYIMTSLRTMWGCDLQQIRKSWGNHPASRISHLASSFITKGWIQQQGDTLLLTDQGKLFADGIAAELFLI